MDRTLGRAALLLLIASLAALCLVPDVGVYRPKIAWARGLILAATGVVLLGQGLRGRFGLKLPATVLASLAPLAVAAAWMALGHVESGLLAHDELIRLGLFPLALWTTGLALQSTRRRRLFLIALSLFAILIGGLAVGQNLAGLLRLPLERQARAFATFGNPVFLGAFLVQTTPLMLVLALYVRGPERWLGALAGGLCLPALLATGTRSAWLGFGAGMIVLAMILVPRPAHRRLLLIGLLVMAVMLTPFVLPHIERPQQHALIWRDTLDLIAEHPLGVGPGQYLLAFVPYASRELLAVYPRNAKIVNDAHSEPLQLLAELGWVGLAAAAVALAVLLRAARDLLARRPTEHAERPLVAACLAALVGAAVQSLASPDLRFVVSVVLAGMIAGLMASHAAPRTLALGKASVLLMAAAVACVWFAFDTTRSSLAVRPLLATSGLTGNLERDDPTQSSPAWLAQSGQRKRALVALTTAVETDPGDWALRLSLGLVQHAEGQLEDAMQSLRAVLELQPGHPQALAALGIIEVQARRFDQAIAHLTDARELLPASEDVRFWLARAALQVGDLSTALREVEALLDLNGSHPGGLLLREKLRE